jgi:hypothetical protein
MRGIFGEAWPGHTAADLVAKARSGYTEIVMAARVILSPKKSGSLKVREVRAAIEQVSGKLGLHHRKTAASPKTKAVLTIVGASSSSQPDSNGPSASRTTSRKKTTHPKP